MPSTPLSSRGIALAITALLHLLLLLLLVTGSTLRSVGRHGAGQSGELLVEATIAPIAPHSAASPAAPQQGHAKPLSSVVAPSQSVGRSMLALGPEMSQPNAAAQADSGFQIGTVAGPDSDFERRLLAHIQQYRHYPDRAKPNELVGIVQVTFTMDRAGNVLAISVTGSSGSPVLDTEAVNTVLRAQPLPAIPSNLPDQLEVQLPVSFDAGRSGALLVAQ